MDKTSFANQLADNFDIILDYIHEDILITDGKGIVMKVSPSFERLYGLDKSHALGRSVYELEKEGYFKPAIIPKVIESGKQITMLQKTIKDRDVVVTATPIFDKDNKIKFVVSFSRDVTEMIALQKEYSRLETETERYKAELKKLRDANMFMDEIVSESKQLSNIMQTISRVADFDVNVLLLGASGVGKTTFAKIIHQSSNRSNASFIDINCAAIPESLLESELFGYEKGAFTGANAHGKVGLIELANGGTLLLDEISEMPLSLQAKLLKTIQDKVLIRVGGTKKINVDFRLIAATNRDLALLVKEGKFRQDLFYRLDVVNITIPPLQERKEDILPLCSFFLDKINEKYGINKKLHPKAKDVLLNYSWPGNVRELSNALERAAVISQKAEIMCEDLNLQLSNSHDHEMIEMDLDKGLPQLMTDIESKIIKEAYDKYGNSVDVAKVLKISQPTASRKINKYIEK